MQLREGERILKIYHHHPTPFFILVSKIALSTLPFYFMLYYIGSSMPPVWYYSSHALLITVFLLAVAYVSLTYWLDRLIITNLRILYIDYKYLTVRDDSQAYLKDIQDIQTQEHGLLAVFKFFDYGTLRLDTPSSYVTLVFEDAPDPESIRQFIYSVRES